MKIFKIIIKTTCILLIPFIFSILIFKFYNLNYISYKKNVEQTISNKNNLKDKDLKCTYSNADNNKKIAQNNNLIYYEGSIVKKEVAKNFSNPAIPKNYKILESDLEEAYALGKNDKPIILMLQFENEENFNKMNEFFGYGEMFVNYNKRSNILEKQIYIGDNFKNLDLYIKLFNKQKCY